MDKFLCRNNILVVNSSVKVKTSKIKIILILLEKSETFQSLLDFCITLFVKKHHKLLNITEK